MSILTKLFGSQNERYLKSLKPIIEKINSLEADTKKLADKDFPAKTKEFKDRLAKGEDLESLVPEAFALVREAAWRTLGQRHYDVS